MKLSSSERDGFHRYADLFPEAILLVDAQGIIQAFNAEAQRQIRGHGLRADHTSLSDIFREPIERIHEYLRSCARTRSFMPGTLCLKSNTSADGCFRAEGALYDRSDSKRLPLLLLRLRPKQTAESGFFALNRQIEKLSREVDQRRRAELELIEEHRRKDEFLAMLAHELRNPLAPITSALQLQSSRNLSEKTRARTLEIMNRQVAHLTRLVNDFLDLARISSGKITLKNELLEVGYIIGLATELCRHAIEEKGPHLNFSTELDSETLCVRGDLERLTQVIANVLSNAVKYVDGGGEIRLTAFRKDDCVELSVVDDGIGIEPAFLPRVFDLFTQSETSLARSRGGLGIGLTIVRRLIEQHHGSITALSEGRGKGSEFRITLPLVKHPPRELEQPAILPPQSARRILVVDDNADAAGMLAELLSVLGHHVTVASSGQDAIATAIQARPEVVLLDIGLPDVDGYEVARSLRRAPETAGSALVALTGYGQAADIQKAESAGFDHHLVKPADINDICRVIAASCDVKNT